MPTSCVPREKPEATTAQPGEEGTTAAPSDFQVLFQCLREEGETQFKDCLGGKISFETTKLNSWLWSVDGFVEQTPAIMVDLMDMVMAER